MRHPKKTSPELDASSHFTSIPEAWAAVAVELLIKFQSAPEFGVEKGREAYQALFDVAWYCVVNGRAPLRNEILAPQVDLTKFNHDSNHLKVAHGQPYASHRVCGIVPRV
ncbi:hypothetical protein DSO57_1023344 [Entomophthora muscae]|uniref:Uncharacterized protein n=1 Tax=Entomophthora muscae TaxID=34485 RepID=A0ACC2RHN1_9FUNG|nr:hypothetical protein DSO57_1023344 [Entomophthora muscae]